MDSSNKPIFHIDTLSLSTFEPSNTLGYTGDSEPEEQEARRLQGWWDDMSGIGDMHLFYFYSAWTQDNITNLDATNFERHLLNKGAACRSLSKYSMLKL